MNFDEKFTKAKLNYGAPLGISGTLVEVRARGTYPWKYRLKEIRCSRWSGSQEAYPIQPKKQLLWEFLEGKAHYGYEPIPGAAIVWGLRSATFFWGHQYSKEWIFHVHYTNNNWFRICWGAGEEMFQSIHFGISKKPPLTEKRGKLCYYKEDFFFGKETI